MRKITIAGIEFTPEPFTDGDLIYLTAATGNMGNIPRDVAEKNAAQVLRDIFPSMPSEWTKGDRLRPPLHRTTLSVISTELQEILASDKSYRDTVEPLKRLPLDSSTKQQLDQFMETYTPKTGDRSSPKNNSPKPRNRNR